MKHPFFMIILSNQNKLLEIFIEKGFNNIFHASLINNEQLLCMHLWNSLQAVDN